MYEEIKKGKNRRERERDGGKKPCHVGGGDGRGGSGATFNNITPSRLS